MMENNRNLPKTTQKPSKKSRQTESISKANTSAKGDRNAAILDPTKKAPTEEAKKTHRPC